VDLVESLHDDPDDADGMDTVCGSCFEFGEMKLGSYSDDERWGQRAESVRKARPVAAEITG